MEPAAPWERIDEGTRKAALDFGADYRRFISCAKTERECAELALSLAQNAGFVPLKECRRVQPGDRVYELWRGKCLALAVVGGGPLERGLNVIGAHIDSPRLDLKPRPLYVRVKIQ